MSAPQVAPRLLISILHWNTPQLSAECLRALRESGLGPHAVVVVDNGSRQDDEAQLRAQLPTLHWLRAGDNLGFAAGHALALAYARDRAFDAIVLLNSDARLEAGTLPALCAAWRTHGDAIYAGLAVDDQGRLQFPAKLLDADFRPAAWARDRPLSDDAGWRQRSPLRVAAVTGSCMLVPLAVVERHGWMDPDWFMYCEELDYCLRLRAAGVASWLVPAARFRHAGAGSSAAWPVLRDVLAYYHSRNEIEWARRHAGTATAILFAAKKLLRALAEALPHPRRACWRLRGIADAARGRLGRRVRLDDWLPR